MTGLETLWECGDECLYSTNTEVSFGSWVIMNFSMMPYCHRVKSNWKSFFQDYIYWADWKTGIIERANKTDGSNRTVIHSKLEFITDILIFHTSRQTAWNQCAVGNGGCSDLCLVLPAVSSRQSSTHYCGCRTHYMLGDDNRTCIGKLKYHIAFPLSLVLVLTSCCVSLVGLCTLSFIAQCSFTVFFIELLWYQYIVKF